MKCSLCGKTLNKNAICINSNTRDHNSIARIHICKDCISKMYNDLQRKDDETDAADNEVASMFADFADVLLTTLKSFFLNNKTEYRNHFVPLHTQIQQSV